MPGPTRIMKAPGCKKPVKISTIASGNTFGATFWTDGKKEAPMLPDEPWLLKSPVEEKLFWADECEEIGQIDNWDSKPVNKEWTKLAFAEEPGEKDYFAALTSDIANTDEKKRYLRMRLWWRGNDDIRRGKKDILSKAHLDNLSAFAELLSSEDPDQRLMKAEIYRELNRFTEAKKLITFKYPKGYSSAVKLIRTLIESQDSRVAELK